MGQESMGRGTGRDEFLVIPRGSGYAIDVSNMMVHGTLSFSF